MLTKRDRSSNFNNAEVQVLVDLVEKYRKTIENKTADAVTWREKEKAWERLSVEFNILSSIVHRSAKTLRIKYEGMKKTLRRKLTSDENNLSDFEEQLLLILSKDNTEGNDSESFQMDESKITVEENNLLEDGNQIKPHLSLVLTDIKEEPYDIQELKRSSIPEKLNPQKKLKNINEHERIFSLKSSRSELLTIQKAIAAKELQIKELELKIKEQEHLNSILESKRKEEEHVMKMKIMKKQLENLD